MVNYYGLQIKTEDTPDTDKTRRIGRVVNVKKDTDKKKKDKKEKERYLYQMKFDTDKELKASESSQNITVDDNEHIQPIPADPVDGWKTRVFIAGGTLSGKSTLASTMIKNFYRNKKNKDSNFILFSSLEYDKVFDEIKGAPKPLRIKLSPENLITEPIELPELANSICVFDDIHLENKAMDKGLTSLMNRVIQAGRHYNILCIICKQNLLDKEKTKVILNNCFSVIGFPRTAGRFQFSSYLDRYMHFRRKDIDYILNLPSRWVMVNRNAPLYVMYEKGCYILQ